LAIYSSQIKVISLCEGSPLMVYPTHDLEFSSYPTPDGANTTQIKSKIQNLIGIAILHHTPHLMMPTQPKSKVKSKT